MIIVEIHAALRAEDWKACDCGHCLLIRQLRLVDPRVGSIPEEIRVKLDENLNGTINTYMAENGKNAKLSCLTPEEYEEMIGSIPTILDQRASPQDEAQALIDMLQLASTLRELIRRGEHKSPIASTVGEKLVKLGVLISVPQDEVGWERLKRDMDKMMPAYVSRVNSLVARMATSGELGGMLANAIAEATATADPRQMAAVILSSFMGPDHKPFSAEKLREKGDSESEAHALVIEAVEADVHPKAIFEFIESHLDTDFKDLKATLGLAIKRLLHGTAEDQQVLEDLYRESQAG